MSCLVIKTGNNPEQFHIDILNPDLSVAETIGPFSEEQTRAYLSKRGTPNHDAVVLLEKARMEYGAARE